MNTESCDCRKVENYEAAKEPGDYFFNGNYIGIILPDGTFNSLPVSGIHTKDSWQWNQNKEKPTLTPSIHCIGHWHGYLTDGKLVSCP